MKKRNILIIIFTLIISAVGWFYFRPQTDLKNTSLADGLTTWENDLFSFQLPKRFYSSKHVHSDHIKNNEYGFFTDGKATFYFSYNNYGASGPEKENQLIDEKRGIFGWKIIKDTIGNSRRKQFYNIDSTNSGWNWAGVYLANWGKSSNHEILFSLAVFDENRETKNKTKHIIDKRELKKILTSVRLK